MEDRSALIGLMAASVPGWDTDAAGLCALVAHAVPSALFHIGRHHNADDAVFTALVATGEDLAFRGMLHNPGCPGWVLHEVALGAGDAAGLRHAAAHPALEGRSQLPLVRRCLETGRSGPLFSLAQRSDLTTGAASRIIGCDTLAVVSALARNPHVGGVLLVQLASSTYRQVRLAVCANPASPTRALEVAWEARVGSLSEPELAAFATHPACPDEVICELPCALVARLSPARLAGEGDEALSRGLATSFSGSTAQLRAAVTAVLAQRS